MRKALDKAIEDLSESNQNENAPKNVTAFLTSLRDVVAKAIRVDLTSEKTKMIEPLVFRKKLLRSEHKRKKTKRIEKILTLTSLDEKSAKSILNLVDLKTDLHLLEQQAKILSQTDALESTQLQLNSAQLFNHYFHTKSSLGVPIPKEKWENMNQKGKKHMAKFKEQSEDESSQQNKDLTVAIKGWIKEFSTEAKNKSNLNSFMTLNAIHNLFSELDLKGASKELRNIQNPIHKCHKKWEAYIKKEDAFYDTLASIEDTTTPTERNQKIKTLKKALDAEKEDLLSSIKNTFYKILHLNASKVESPIASKILLHIKLQCKNVYITTFKYSLIDEIVKSFSEFELEFKDYMDEIKKNKNKEEDGLTQNIFDIIRDNMEPLIKSYIKRKIKESIIGQTDSLDEEVVSATGHLDFIQDFANNLEALEKAGLLKKKSRNNKYQIVKLNQIQKQKRTKLKKWEDYLLLKSPKTTWMSHLKNLFKKLTSIFSSTPKTQAIPTESIQAVLSKTNLKSNPEDRIIKRIKKTQDAIIKEFMHFSDLIENDTYDYTTATVKEKLKTKITQNIASFNSQKNQIKDKDYQQYIDRTLKKYESMTTRIDENYQQHVDGWLKKCLEKDENEIDLEKNINLIDHLINQGADVIVDQETQKTVLHVAAEKGFLDLVIMLCEKHPTLINKKCHDTSTALSLVSKELESAQRAKVPLNTVEEHVKIKKYLAQKMKLLKVLNKEKINFIENDIKESFEQAHEKPHPILKIKSLQHALELNLDSKPSDNNRYKSIGRGWIQRKLQDNDFKHLNRMREIYLHYDHYLSKLKNVIHSAQNSKEDNQAFKKAILETDLEIKQLLKELKEYVLIDNHQRFDEYVDEFNKTIESKREECLRELDLSKKINHLESELTEKIKQKITPKQNDRYEQIEKHSSYFFADKDYSHLNELRNIYLHYDHYLSELEKELDKLKDPENVNRQYLERLKKKIKYIAKSVHDETKAFKATIPIHKNNQNRFEEYETQFNTVLNKRKQELWNTLRNLKPQKKHPNRQHKS